MASDIPPCSLENNSVFGLWDSSGFVLDEIINPNIGNMDGSRNDILVEDEQLSGNIDFVRGLREHCPLSNDCCEGAAGPGTAKSVLRDDLEDFRITGYVRQSGDFCSLSNTDFILKVLVWSVIGRTKRILWSVLIVLPYYVLLPIG